MRNIKALYHPYTIVLTTKNHSKNVARAKFKRAYHWINWLGNFDLYVLAVFFRFKLKYSRIHDWKSETTKYWLKINEADEFATNLQFSIKDPWLVRFSISLYYIRLQCGSINDVGYHFRHNYSTFFSFRVLFFKINIKSNWVQFSKRKWKWWVCACKNLFLV